MRVAFALANFVDLGADVPDVPRAELIPFTLDREAESAVEPGKRVPPPPGTMTDKAAGAVLHRTGGGGHNSMLWRILKD
jgi:hypothetical protein